jgi:hypothetical protein
MAPRKLIPDDLPAIPKSGVVRTRKERILAKANELAKRDREATPASRGPATRGGVRSMKATAGGTGPKAKSSSGGGGEGTFKSAFATAHAARKKGGSATFTWNGKKYHTKTAEEMGGAVKAKSSSNKAAAKPDPNPGVKRNQGMLGSERPARSTPQPSPARPGSTAAARTGGPQGGRGGGGGTSGNRMRAAAAKAFWGNNPVPMQGPGPAVQAQGPGPAVQAQVGPVTNMQGQVVPPNPGRRHAQALGARMADAPRRWGERAAAATSVGAASPLGKLSEQERDRDQRRQAMSGPTTPGPYVPPPNSTPPLVPPMADEERRRREYAERVGTVTPRRR